MHIVNIYNTYFKNVHVYCIVIHQPGKGDFGLAPPLRSSISADIVHALTAHGTAHLFCCQRWPSSFHMFSRLAQVSSALLSHPLYGQIFVNKNGSSKFTWNWVRLGENKQIWLKMAQVIPSENSPENFRRLLHQVAAREGLHLSENNSSFIHFKPRDAIRALPNLTYGTKMAIRRDRIPFLHLLQCHPKWPNHLDNAINQHAASKKGLIYVNSSPVCQKWIEMGCINYPLQVQIDVWVDYIATIHDINYNPSRKSVDQK